MNYRRWGGVGWSEDFFFLGGGGGAHGFQGEWRGDLSSPAEYKENSIENRQPVRGRKKIFLIHPRPMTKKPIYFLFSK